MEKDVTQYVMSRILKFHVLLWNRVAYCMCTEETAASHLLPSVREMPKTDRPTCLAFYRNRTLNESFCITRP
jgi:hypothetical protein